MTFLHPSEPVLLTHEQTIAFRDLCTNTQAGAKAVARQAKEQLEGLPPERARALLCHLWEQDEPSRRKWAARGQFFVWLSLVAWFGGGATLLVLEVLSHLGYRFSCPNMTWTTMVGSGCNLVAMSLWRKAPAPAQRGSVSVLLQHPSVELCGLLVDAHSFRNLGGALPKCVALRAALTQVLPQFARSDAPPLDAYRNQVLCKALRGYARRLRKPDATIADDEVAFLCAIIGYLAAAPTLQSAVQETKHDAHNTEWLLRRLSALTAHAGESDNRRAVRETSQTCLPLLSGRSSS